MAAWHTVALIETAGAKGKTLAVINDLPTAAKSRAMAMETATVTLTKFGIAIAETTIGHSPAMVDAIGLVLGITEKSPKIVASKETESLWTEIVSRTGGDAVKEAAQ